MVRTQSETPPDPERILPPEAVKARNRRNIAIALALAGFALLFFVMTIVKLGNNYAPG